MAPGPRPHTVVVGVGNPLVTDDAVGVRVAREVRAALGDSRPDVEVTELFVGGMALMETIVGYDRAIVVDAMVTGDAPGTIHHLPVEALAETRNSTCLHDTSFSTALDLARALDLPLPACIELWGVEAVDLCTFSESLTPAVAAAVPRLASSITAALACPRREEGAPR
jgi:hydrogenase maturation protease